MIQTDKINLKEQMSLLKVAAFIFIPTALLTVIYIFMGYMQTSIPSLLLFFLLAMITMFPFQMAIVLKESKREHGKYYLKSAFNHCNKMSPLKIFVYGAVLFGFAGLMSITLARLENSLFAPLIITVLFSLYHFWLPFNNLFRICVFFPAAWMAWKKKNIYISIVFHCFCNLFSTISFIVSVYS